jgi:glycosyltransferase involved in cell wall biosynthesis
MSRRPIRVLFVEPDLQIGGAERHVTTLLPRMDPARFTPSVICIGEEGGLFGSLTAASVDARALHLGGARNALRALAELIMVTRRSRPDVVVVRSFNAETLGRIAARIAGVKHSIVWVHSMLDLRPRSRFRVAIDRALTRWTSGYFGVAEAQRHYLVNELGIPADKIRIIHNGVDLTVFDPSTDRSVLAEFGFTEHDPVVGIVAGLHPWKDHATLLHAARKVIDSMPDAKFLIIGDGVTRPQLETLCASLQIAANVHFTGARDDVARLLAAIDVFALTSTTEAFPISLLEAMACGRPAVCTAVGGVPEVLDDGVSGYLVPPRDPQRLADRLLKLLSDPDAARRMGRAGRDCVEARFSLEQSVARAEQAIQDVVTGRGLLSERVGR